MAKRSGRGKLSSIEILPEVCDEDIAWVNAELKERRIPQTEILREFNARIADHGCKPISKGAFSRYSVRKAQGSDVREVPPSRDAKGASGFSSVSVGTFMAGCALGLVLGILLRRGDR
jgi:hypothetical protein